MSIRAQFWVSGHRREWGKPGVMARQDDLRLIILPPPNVDQSVLLRSCPIPKGREAGSGRQGMPNIYQHRPELTGWGICWVSVLLRGKNPLSTPSPTRVGWRWTCHEIISSLWVAVSFLKGRVKLCYLSLPHVHNGSSWNGHLFGPNALGWNSLCGRSKHSSHRARARTGYSFLRRSNEMYVNNSPLPPPTPHL